MVFELFCSRYSYFLQLSKLIVVFGNGLSNLSVFLTNQFQRMIPTADKVERKTLALESNNLRIDSREKLRHHSQMDAQFNSEETITYNAIQHSGIRIPPSSFANTDMNSQLP
ncbi:hypothetical protein D915_007265 [Fasciola hepatica]|uniref:Uncharacterized protein n=1 Tax=Fasciola hepatica TaxID=6192 RepID=A0A4E0R1L4_FASHE|nr:hypothetical protein D915_007265 [Fasciola hepatica]